jgi:hypothetical protein
MDSDFRSQKSVLVRLHARMRPETVYTTTDRDPFLTGPHEMLTCRQDKGIREKRYDEIQYT